MGKKENYVRDYQEGICSQRETSTPSEVSETKKSILVRINKMIENQKKHLTRSVSILAIMLCLVMTLTSCNKQNYDPPTPTPTERTITQTFTLQTITTTDEMIAKQFDPATWVYQYSDVKYLLTISNAQNTYTKSVSVNDMLTGSITFSLVRGTYNVTYTPINLPMYDTKLNVFINMTDVLITGTPIVLEGQLDDALVIIDIPAVEKIYNPYPTEVMNHDARGFYWAYVNKPLNDANGSTLDLFSNTWGTPADKLFRLDGSTTPPFALGKVFWAVSNLGVTVQLNIPAMTVQQVIFN